LKTTNPKEKRDINEAREQELLSTTTVPATQNHPQFTVPGSVPLSPVLRALKQIPHGETSAYFQKLLPQLYPNANPGEIETWVNSLRCMEKSKGKEPSIIDTTTEILDPKGTSSFSPLTCS
jgi:hypothetical protein